MKLFRMFLLPFICIQLTIAFYSCKDHSVDPIDPPKNPAEYIWTADTLAIDADEIQCLMESVWGTSLPTSISQILLSKV